jgi:hypothetical protein
MCALSSFTLPLTDDILHATYNTGFPLIGPRVIRTTPPLIQLPVYLVIPGSAVLLF